MSDLKQSGTRRQAAIEPLRTMPRPRLLSKLWRTVIGGLVALGGIALVWAGVRHDPDPVLWLVMTGLAIVVAGAHVTSAELTRTALAFVVGAIRDLAGALARRGNGTPPAGP